VFNGWHWLDREPGERWYVPWAPLGERPALASCWEPIAPAELAARAAPAAAPPGKSVRFYIEPIVTRPGGEQRCSYDPTRTQRRQVRCHAASDAAAATATPPPSAHLAGVGGRSRRELKSATKASVAAVLGGYDDEQLDENEWDERFMQDGRNYFMSTASGVYGTASDDHALCGFAVCDGLAAADSDDGSDHDDEARAA